MRPYLRSLKIAWSILCVLACAALIGFWLQSANGMANGPQISHLDQSKRLFQVWSVDGAIHLNVTHAETAMTWPANKTYPEIGRTGWQTQFAERGMLGFGVLDKDHSFDVRVPYWFTILLSGVFATAPWLIAIRWRFSLRTLLIATTLVAAMLGLVAWSMH